MTAPIALALLGFGLGALVIANGPSRDASTLTLRERAQEAQRASAIASQRARELAARWSAERERLAAGDRR